MFSINGLKPRLCYDPITATLMVASLAMSGMAAASAYKNSKNQAKAVAEEGRLKAVERAKQTRILASSQRESFLSSGISLTGDGVAQGVVDSTYVTGLEDIGQIKQNYDQKSSNIMGAARSKLMSDLGGMALGGASSGIFSGAGGAGTGAGGGISMGGGMTTSTTRGNTNFISSTVA